jgi:protein TonB
MTAATLRHEVAGIQSRTRRAIVVSLVAHLILLLGLSLYRQLSPQTPVLTEVTWFEPAAAKPAPPPPAPKPSPSQETFVQPFPVDNQRHFEREMPRGDVAPQPQEPEVRDDRLEQRLAALQTTSAARRTLAGIPEPASISTGMAAADVDPLHDAATQPEELRRAEHVAGPPVALTRAEPTAQPEVLAVAPAPETPIAPAASEEAEGATVRHLAGASLIGPVADRRLVSYTTPAYPDWAKREGVEGSVSIRFIVLPDGRVKPNILVEKTSGFEDFDRNAKDALLGWRFEPLEKGAHGDQWGVITFNYRLNDARRP